MTQVKTISRDNHKMFIPIWTDVIKKYLNKVKDWNNSYDTVKLMKIKPLGLDIGSAKCCLVGEAHHFTGEYALSLSRKECNVCERFSYSIFSVLKSKKIERFYQWKNQVYNHMKKMHPELVIGIK